MEPGDQRARGGASKPSKHSRLLDLGLQPHLLTDAVLDEMLDAALRYRSSIDVGTITPTVTWTSGEAQGRLVAT